MAIPNLFPSASARKAAALAMPEEHSRFVEHLDSDNAERAATPARATVAGFTAAPVVVPVVAAREALPTEPADPPAAMPIPQQDASQVLVSVPGLGRRTVRSQRRLLSALLVVSLAAVLPAAAYKLELLDTLAQQIAVIGQSQMQSQRLAKSVTQALVGNPQAFVDLASSADVLSRSVAGLARGDAGMRIQALSDDLQPTLRPALALTEQAQKSSSTILAQQKILEQIGVALVSINRQSEDLLELTKTISSMKQQQGASPGDISAVGELSTLTQRIGKSPMSF